MRPASRPTENTAAAPAASQATNAAVDSKDSKQPVSRPDLPAAQAVVNPNQETGQRAPLGQLPQFDDREDELHEYDEGEGEYEQDEGEYEDDEGENEGEDEDENENFDEPAPAATATAPFQFSGEFQFGQLNQSEQRQQTPQFGQTGQVPAFDWKAPPQPSAQPPQFDWSTPTQIGQSISLKQPAPLKWPKANESSQPPQFVWPGQAVQPADSVPQFAKTPAAATVTAAPRFAAKFDVKSETVDIKHQTIPTNTTDDKLISLHDSLVEYNGELSTRVIDENLFIDITENEKSQLQLVSLGKTVYQRVRNIADEFRRDGNAIAELLEQRERALIDCKDKNDVEYIRREKEALISRQCGCYAQELFWRTKLILLLNQAKTQILPTEENAILYSKIESTLANNKDRIVWLQERQGYSHRSTHGLLLEYRPSFFTDSPSQTHYITINDSKISLGNYKIVSAVPINASEVLVRLGNKHSRIRFSMGCSLAILNLNSSTNGKTTICFLKENFTRNSSEEMNDFNMPVIGGVSRDPFNRNNMVYLANQCFAVKTLIKSVLDGIGTGTISENHIEIFTWSENEVSLVTRIAMPHEISKIFSWSHYGFLLTSQYILDQRSFLISLWNPYTGECLEEITSQQDIFTVLPDGKIVFEKLNTLDPFNRYLKVGDTVLKELKQGFKFHLPSLAKGIIDEEIAEYLIADRSIIAEIVKRSKTGKKTFVKKAQEIFNTTLLEQAYTDTDDILGVINKNPMVSQINILPQIIESELKSQSVADSKKPIPSLTAYTPSDTTAALDTKVVPTYNFDIKELDAILNDDDDPDTMLTMNDCGPSIFNELLKFIDSASNPTATADDKQLNTANLQLIAAENIFSFAKKDIKATNPATSDEYDGEFDPKNIDLARNSIFADITASQKEAIQRFLKNRTIYQAVRDIATILKSNAEETYKKLKEYSDVDKTAEQIEKEKRELAHTESKLYAEEAFWRTKQLLLLSLAKQKAKSTQNMTVFLKIKRSLKATKARLSWSKSHALNYSFVANGLLLNKNLHNITVGNHKFEFKEQEALCAIPINAHEMLVRIGNFDWSIGAYSCQLARVNLHDKTITHLEGHVSGLACYGGRFFYNENNMVNLGNQCIALLTCTGIDGNRCIEILNCSAKKVEQTQRIITSHYINKIWCWSQYGLLLTQSRDYFKPNEDTIITLWNPYTGERLREVTIDREIFSVLPDGKIILSDLRAIMPFTDYIDAGDQLLSELKTPANARFFSKEAPSILIDSNFVNRLVAKAKRRVEIAPVKQSLYYGQFNHPEQKDEHAVRDFLSDATQIEKTELLSELRLSQKNLYQVVCARENFYQKSAEESKDADQKQLHLIHKHYWCKKQLELLLLAKNRMPLDNNLERVIDRQITWCLQQISHEPLDQANIFCLRLFNGEIVSFNYPQVKINANPSIKMYGASIPLPLQYHDYKIIGVTAADGDVVLRIGKQSTNNEYVNCKLFSIQQHKELGDLPTVKAFINFRDRIQNDLLYLGDKQIAIRTPDANNLLTQIQIWSWKENNLISINKLQYRFEIKRMESTFRDPIKPHRLLIATDSNRFSIFDLETHMLVDNIWAYCGNIKAILPKFSAIVCENSVLVNGYQIFITHPTLAFTNAQIKPNDSFITTYSRQLAIPELRNNNSIHPRAKIGEEPAPYTANTKAKVVTLNNDAMGAKSDSKDVKSAAKDVKAIKTDPPAGAAAPVLPVEYSKHQGNLSEDKALAKAQRNSLLNSSATASVTAAIPTAQGNTSDVRRCQDLLAPLNNDFVNNDFATNAFDRLQGSFTETEALAIALQNSKGKSTDAKAVATHDVAEIKTAKTQVLPKVSVTPATFITNTGTNTAANPMAAAVKPPEPDSNVKDSTQLPKFRTG